MLGTAISRARRNRKLLFEALDRRDLLSIAPVDDLYQVQEDLPIVIGPEDGVLANDPEEAASAILVEGPSHGTVFLNPSGAFAYSPAVDFVGEDSFVYRLGNGAPAETATVTLNVSLDTSGTVAVDDSYLAEKNVPLEVDNEHGLLANDAQTLVCELVTSPAHGTLALSPDGSFTYWPDEGYVGDDTFLYRGISAAGADVGRVTISVANTAPVAVDDEFEANEDSVLEIPASAVLVNDSDPNGDEIAVAAVVTSPEHGTVTLNADGSFTYTPEAEYVGFDSFTYQVSDGDLLSEPATVTIRVNPVNDPPVAHALQGVTVAEDTAVTGTLTGDDGDPEPEVVQTLTFALAHGPEHGSVVINPSTGEFTYTPDADYNGPDSFSFTVTDDGLPGDPTGLTSEAAWVTITVTPVPDPVFANDDEYVTGQDIALIVLPADGVLANDLDIDGDAMASILTLPKHGDIIFLANGSFGYMPDSGFFGPDSFTYYLRNSRYHSQATVDIWVNAVPVAEDDAAITDENTSLTVSAPGVLGNDSDEDGGTLTAVLAGEPAHGTVELGSDGSFTYMPDEDFYGEDSFTYYAYDGEIYSDPATVTITVNAIPEAEDDEAITDQGTPLTVMAPGVLGNDFDAYWGTLVAELGEEPEYGELTLNADGSFTYTPDEGFYGEDWFTYYAFDGRAYSEEATVTVLVNAIPEANDDEVITDQNTPLVLHQSDALANDSDAFWGELSVEIVDGPSHGTLTFNEDDTATYTPDEDFYGEDSFTYRAFDGRAYSNVATVTIVVNAIPEAEDDEAITDQDTPLTVMAPGVLGNDFDPYWGTLTVELGSGPENGTLTLNADGSFTYTPDEGFYGEDAFTYYAFDGRVYSNEATVTVLVNAIPEANDDEVITDQDTPLVLHQSDALANDSDAFWGELSAEIVDGPSHGTLTFNEDETATYTPDEGFYGEDSFTYQLFDGRAYSNVATVTIVVNAIPEAEDDEAVTDQDTPLTVAAPGVLGNDFDAYWGTLTVELGEGPENGTVTLNADGSFTYTPDEGFYGEDAFTYYAFDGRVYSNEATVIITVNAIPEAEDDEAVTDQDTPLTVAAPGVLGNDGDADGDDLTAVLVSGTDHGELTLNADGSFTYTPDEGFYGEDAFVYQAFDGRAYSNEATVTITVNAIPEAEDDEAITDQDTPLTVMAPGVLGNDFDAYWGTLTVELGEEPENGTLTLNADGSFTYTPDEGFYGQDSFTYYAFDGRAYSNEATVTIRVNAIPEAEDDDAITDQNSSLTVTAPGVLGNDSDADGDDLTAVLVSGTAHGELTLNADGSFAYTPDEGFYGQDSFTYQAFDGRAYSNEATVTIRVNAIPEAEDDEAITDEGSSLTVTAPGVLGNDGDADGDDLTAVLVSGPAHGGLTLNADGSFTYTPAAGFYGQDAFTYQANDGRVDSAPATVTITVNAIPVANDDAVITDQDTPLVLHQSDALANDSDAFWGELSVEIVDGPGHGTLTFNADDTATYTPATGFYGQDTFTYRAFDGRAYSNVATVTITVNAIPVANDDEASTNQNSSLTVAAPGVLQNDTDAYGGALTAVLVHGPDHGNLTLNADGSFTYVPAAGFFGHDSFTYRAFDGRVYSEVATVTITVNNSAALRAYNDAYSVVAGGFLQVTGKGPLTNDVNPDGDPLTMVVVTQPSNFAFFAWNKSGRFVYQPRVGFVGVDTFTYYATDGTHNSNVATVSITVTPTGPTLKCSNWLENLVTDTFSLLPSQSELRSLLNAAIAKWTEAGVSSQIASLWSKVKIQVCDLPGSQLASAMWNNTIYLDVNAAGCGWFWGAVPGSNQGFTYSAGASQLQAVDSRAANRVDLLSVLMHELGHLGGLSDLQLSNTNLMNEWLGTGVRRLPSAAEVALIFAQDLWSK